MRMKKMLTAAMACVFVCGTALTVHAIEQEPAAQEVTVSYDSSELAAYAEQVAVLVNQERAANGLQPVQFSARLSEAAAIRSGELKENFSHTRPDGTSCFTVLDELGISYRSAAENIAYGQRSPESVMNAWMNSSGHRANILSENMEYIGVGVVYRDGIYYWTQLFAASSDLSGEDTEQPAVTTAATETTAQTTTTTLQTTAATVQTTAAESSADTELTTTEQSTTTASEQTTAAEPETTASETVQTTTEPVSTEVSTESEMIATTQTTVCEPVITEETTTTCQTETTVDYTVITKPLFTLPVSGDCSVIGGGALVVISPK